MRNALRHRALTFTAAAVLAVLLGAAVLAARNALSQAPSGVVDFTKVTTVPFTGYPSTITVPDLREPTCQAPANERPLPDAPPLSCRLSSGEPPPGTIPTASAAQRPAPAAARADGTVIADNRLFRYTIAIPPGWYSNMRPEGGTFQLTDPAATSETVHHDNPPGGIVMIFGARTYAKPRVGGVILEQRLEAPNATFGSFPGVVWDEGPGEGAAAIIHAEFRNGDVVFTALVLVADDGRPRETIAADVASARAVVTSIRPY